MLIDFFFVFFKVIVLARVIADTDDDQVMLTANAIMKLAELLLLTNTSLITQIGNGNKIFEYIIIVLYF